MISQTLLKQLAQLAYPGITIHYSEIQDVKDKTTISDPKGELAKTFSSNNITDIAKIVEAIYANSKYQGMLVNDNGKLKMVSNNKLYEVRVTNTGSILKIIDLLNRKDTIIEYKTSYKKEVKKSLQDQILSQLEKRKMSDKEVIEYIRSLNSGLK